MLRRCPYQQSESQESPSDILNYKELQEKVARILERLPERCGKIFTMSRFEGLKIYRDSRKIISFDKNSRSKYGQGIKRIQKGINTIMKEMKKIERFTDKEWEELASILSDEKGEQKDLLDRFKAGDIK